MLLAPGNYIQTLQHIALEDADIYAMPFSALAQSCKTYDEYGEKISSVSSESIVTIAIGLIGPKKKIAKLTGNLPLYK